MPRTVADLAFCERPLHELLHLDVDRDEPSHEYAGVGWAIAPSLWLEAGAEQSKSGILIQDALVLALHSADDAECLASDIELEFVGPHRFPRSEVPNAPFDSQSPRDGTPQGDFLRGDVCVLASTFLAHWLPRLPRTSAIVLALCNPHRAALRAPDGIAVPLHFGVGEVASWRERANDGTERVILTADTWRSHPSPTTKSEVTSRSIF